MINIIKTERKNKNIAFKDLSNNTTFTATKYPGSLYYKTSECGYIEINRDGSMLFKKDCNPDWQPLTIVNIKSITIEE